jgi:hypothetical protein
MKTMRKTRLYLESSPIIRINDDKSPIRQAITKEFFRILAERSDEYELFISRVTVEELDETKSDEKREASTAFLNEINCTRIPHNDKVENLAWTYVSEGVLSQSHIDDLLHVAYAVVSHCDYIVTWNMRHLANDKTVSRVNTVNAIENYGKIFITTPEFFTGGKIYGK